MRWGCVGVALGLSWGCLGVALGLRWGCVGVALGLRWGCVGVALGLRWGCVGLGFFFSFNNYCLLWIATILFVFVQTEMTNEGQVRPVFLKGREGVINQCIK